MTDETRIGGGEVRRAYLIGMIDGLRDGANLLEGWVEICEARGFVKARILLTHAADRLRGRAARLERGAYAP